MLISSTTVSMLLLLASFIGIVLWVFRPNSTGKYREYSKIPIQNNSEHDISGRE